MGSNGDNAPVAEDSTLVFSFGSNSTAQLRARVKADSLSATKACLPGFVPPVTRGFHTASNRS
jgi:hypothetical protein